MEQNKLTPSLYCIKIQLSVDCWVADWDGDPGMTLVKQYAKKFKSKEAASKFLTELKKKYPNRNFFIDPFLEK